MAKRRRGGGKGMISYQNIRSGLDFVKSFNEAQETVDFLERKVKRLQRERDSAKKSLGAVMHKYHILSLKYSALKPSCGCFGYPF